MEERMARTKVPEVDVLDIRDFEDMQREHILADFKGFGDGFHKRPWLKAEIMQEGRQSHQNMVYFEWEYQDGRCWSAFMFNGMGGGGEFKLVHTLLPAPYVQIFCSAPELLELLETAKDALEDGPSDKSAYLPFAYSHSVLKEALERVAKRRLLAQKIYTA